MFTNNNKTCCVSTVINTVIFFFMYVHSYFVLFLALALNYRKLVNTSLHVSNTNLTSLSLMDFSFAIGANENTTYIYNI